MKNVALYVIIGISSSSYNYTRGEMFPEFITFSYRVFGPVGVYTNTAKWKKLIRTVHFSLRIHIFGHATKLGCLYFGFRQSNQHRPSFKPYACIPDLFDEIALMFRLLRTISVSCTTFTSQVTFHKSEKIARDTDSGSLHHTRTRLIWGVYISSIIHFENEIQFLFVNICLLGVRFFFSNFSSDGRQFLQVWKIIFLHLQTTVQGKLSDKTEN